MTMTRHVARGGRALALAAAVGCVLAVALPAASQDTPPPEPDMVPVTPEPIGPFVDEGYKVMVRPAFWLAVMDTSFRKGPDWTGATFSLEDDFDASSFQVVFPLEVCARTTDMEFRFRYMFWNESATRGFTGDFGNASFSAEPVEVDLDTDVFGVDFLYRIVDRDAFDLFFSTGADLFSTEMSLSGASGSDSIDETVPIITVGLGLRVRLKDELNLYVSSAALSYSQLLGMDEEFFGVNDTYRNIEVSLQWDLFNDASWGVAYKHYEVGFDSPRLTASQDLKGVSVWYSRRF
ncbi:MAG: hypothetical protein ACYTKD_05290 [Planctomycetota bacterium]|jgi:hypothetical protein